MQKLGVVFNFRLLAVALLFPLVVSGQTRTPSVPGGAPLSLPDTLKLALANNYRVESNQLEADISAGRLQSEQGVFDPEVSSDYQRQEDGSSQQLDPRIGEATDNQLFLQDRYQAGITGNLPWGMNYDIGLDTLNRRGDFNNFSQQYDTFAGITVSQPLLRGFGSKATMSGIRQARLDVVISGWTLAQEVIDVATETVLVFNDYYLAGEELRVARKSKALATQLLEDNMKRAEIGVMTPLDVTSARAEVASRQEAVLQAELSIVESRNALLQLITRETTPRTLRSRQVATTAAPTLHPLYTDPDTILPGTLLRRPDYRTALLSLEKQEIQLAFEKNSRLPQLDLVASFGVNGLNRRLVESIEQAIDEGNSEWTAGFSFSLPIPNRAARGRVFAEEMALAQALINTKRLEQTIAVELLDATEQVDTARKLITATRTTRELAEERLDAEQEKLQAGTTTTFVVLELQKDLAEAEIRELRARIGYNQAVAEQDRAAGLTLQRYGLTVDGLPQG